MTPTPALGSSWVTMTATNAVAIAEDVAFTANELLVSRSIAAWPVIFRLVMTVKLLVDRSTLLARYLAQHGVFHSFSHRPKVEPEIRTIQKHNSRHRDADRRLCAFRPDLPAPGNNSLAGKRSGARRGYLLGLRPFEQIQHSIKTVFFELFSYFSRASGGYPGTRLV